MITYRNITGYKYQLLETYEAYIDLFPVGIDIVTDFIELSRQGVLKIRFHYAWDGPSGPAFDTKNFLRGSLAHDALYQLIRMGMLPASKRAAADRVLFRMCKEDGMSTIRAAWVYSSLRTFGGLATNPRNQDRDIALVAP